MQMCVFGTHMTQDERPFVVHSDCETSARDVQCWERARGGGHS